MKKILLVLSIIICIALGGVYFQVTQRAMHPAIYQCEKFIIDGLKSPNSYEMIEARMFLTKKTEGDLNEVPCVLIEFLAKNALGTELKGNATFFFEYISSKENLSMEELEDYKVRHLNQNPFKVIFVTELDSAIIDGTVYNEENRFLSFAESNLSIELIEYTKMYNIIYRGVQFPVKITEIAINKTGDKLVMYYTFSDENAILTYDPSKLFPYE